MATKKQAPKKRRGPAPRGDYAGKAKTINTRVTPELRDCLEMAAKKSGRSLSQEIELRLRQTFGEEEKLADRFGSHRTARVFQVIAHVLNAMRNPGNPNAEWLDDPNAFQLGMEAIYHVLYAIRPKEAPNPFLGAGLDLEVDPKGVSLRKWRDIASSDTALPLDKLPSEQFFDRVTKNKIPEIVERAGERVNVAEREERPDEDLTDEQYKALAQLSPPHRVKK